MSDSPWFRFYPGDYFAKTGRLTTIENGAYCLLMFHYYTTGPLPNNDDDLATLAKCSKKQWSRVKPRIWSYFMEENGVLHNSRCDEEIERRKYVIEQKKAAGSIGGKAKHTLQQTLEHTLQRQSSIRPSEPEPESSTTTSNPLCANAHDAFDEFWQAYPSKKDKKKARKAWTKINPENLPAILEAIKVQSETDQWLRGFIPHPTTWLNGERWQDEQPTTETAPLGQCWWNRNGTREMAGQPQCPEIATTETAKGPYCKHHAARINDT